MTENDKRMSRSLSCCRIRTVITAGDHHEPGTYELPEVPQVDYYILQNIRVVNGAPRATSHQGLSLDILQVIVSRSSSTR